VGHKRGVWQLPGWLLVLQLRAPAAAAALFRPHQRVGVVCVQGTGLLLLQLQGCCRHAPSMCRGRRQHPTPWMCPRGVAVRAGRVLCALVAATHNPWSESYRVASWFVPWLRRLQRRAACMQRCMTAAAAGSEAAAACADAWRGSSRHTVALFCMQSSALHTNGPNDSGAQHQRAYTSCRHESS
jgi:hypothetical protein